MISNPGMSKYLVFFVTNFKLWASAVAAIRPSIAGRLLIFAVRRAQEFCDICVDVNDSVFEPF